MHDAVGTAGRLCGLERVSSTKGKVGKITAGLPGKNVHSHVERLLGDGGNLTES